MFSKLKTRWLFQVLILGVLFCIGLVRPIYCQSTPSITRFALDDAVVCIASSGDIKPDNAGAGLERWLAQSEIKDSYLSLVDLLDENLSRANPESAGLSHLLPQIVLGQPWIFVLDQPDLENPQIKFAANLGELENSLRQKIDALVAASEEDVREFSLAGENFRALPGDAENFDLEFGIHKNHLIAAVGKGELAKLIDRFDAAEPKWVGEIQAELPLERTSIMVLIDIKRLVEQAGQVTDKTLQTFKFDEMEKIVGVIGFEGEETVGRFAFHCPQTLTGFWKMFDVAPLKIEDLKGVSDSVHSLTSIKFNGETLWKLLLQNEDSRQDMEEFQAMMKNEYDLDFDKDIVEAFGEHVYSYQQISLLNPTAGTLVGIKVKNPEKFQVLLTEMLANFEESSEEFGFDVEETKNGPLYTLIPFDPNMQMSMPGVCFQLIDDELLIGLDPKAINSHIRKSGRSGGKLTDDPRMARVFDDQKNGGLGQPISVFYLDVKVLLETTYSVLPILFGQFDQMGMETGFDMELLPPLETVIAGISPDIIAIYRTEKGFQMVERSTLPGISMSSAGAVALLLPAVQQARVAARRATSQNNLRQLGIAVLNYESAYMRLPPAYHVSDEGKKLLSWRVEILPYLDENELYKKFKHDEPWDSPHNKALIAEMPDVFKHPALSLEQGQTVYLGVTGKDSAFVPAKEKRGRGLASIVDGTSNTLMMVEANKDHAVYWTQPEDFNVDEMENLAAALRGNWPGGGYHVAFCDCSIRFMKVGDARLRKMATVNGREVINNFDDDDEDDEDEDDDDDDEDEDDEDDDGDQE